MQLSRYLIIIILVIFYITIAVSAEITIIYSGSANGILESCHCPGNPFGGLVNRGAAIDSLKRIFPQALIFDVGDFLPAPPDSLKAVFTLKALENCSIDAIAPGDQEFILGRDFIIKTDLPLISPSIFNPDNKNYLFRTHRLFEIEGVGIAVTSLINPALFTYYPDSVRDAIGIEAPEAAWKRFGKLLGEKADITIVLSHMGYENDVRFLQNSQEIDILISGHSQVLLKEPEQYGSSLLLAPGKNGEHVGILHLQVDSTGRIADYKHELIPLIAEKVGESEPIRKLIDEYNILLREQLKHQAAAAGRKYLGTETCAECHKKQYLQWKNTPHANALATLNNMGKANNPSCLDCHTTGFGYPGGFISIEETPDMGGVGCEECHRLPPGTEVGPGQPHKALPVIEKWCARCHRKPHIIEFDFEEMKKKVEHNE